MPVRARDVRANIKDMGFEKGMAHTLEVLCEEHVDVLKQLVTLSQIQSDMLDRMMEFIKLGDGMSKRIDELKRDQRTGDALDHGDSV